MEKKVMKYAINPWRCVYEWIPCLGKMVQMCIFLMLQMSKRSCILKGVVITHEFKKIVASKSSTLSSHMYIALEFFFVYSQFSNQSICNAIPHEHFVKYSRVCLILPHLAWIPWILTLLVKISISHLACIMCKVRLPLKCFQKVKDA
jgi:hypothetical protein